MRLPKIKLNDREAETIEDVDTCSKGKESKQCGQRAGISKGSAALTKNPLQIKKKKLWKMRSHILRRLATARRPYLYEQDRVSRAQSLLSLDKIRKEKVLGCEKKAIGEKDKEK